MNVPVMIQMHTGENGATALSMILAYYKKYLPLSAVREKCLTSRNGSTPAQLLQAAEEFGLKGSIDDVELSGLKKMTLPAIVSWNKKYYVVVCAFRGGNVYINDPAGGAYAVTEERFARSFSGCALSLEPGPGFQPEGHREPMWTLLWRRLRSGRRSLLTIFLLHALSTAAHLILLELTRRMLDQVMGGEHPGLYVPLLAGMGTALLVGTGLSILETVRIYRISRRMAAESGGRLFRQMLDLPMRFYEQHFAGDILDRMSKNSRLDYSLLRTILPAVINTASLVFYLAMLVFYEPLMAVLCLAVEVLYILLSLWLQSRIAIQSRSLSTSRSAMNTSLLNGFNTIETIKSIGAEKSFFSLWSTSQTAMQTKSAQMDRMNALSSFLGAVHNVISSACLLFVGAVLIIRGQFTMGMLATFQSVLNQVRRDLTGLVSTSNNLTSSRTDIERVEDVLEQEPESPVSLREESQARKLSGVLDIEHVTFRYNPGDRPAVADVSLHIKPRQMVALVGSTGCGKSTLMKLIAGLCRADEGQILYDGLRRDEIPDVTFHSSLACVDQEITVFNDTLANNLKMWDGTIENFEMILAARDAQIHDRIIRAPGAYDAVVFENGRNFSGGELQRLELARALSPDPTILLLDEFTSALDALTEEKVFRAIRDKGTTCVLAAHRFSTVVECDWIVVMEKGRIVEQGTHSELYRANGLYRQLVDLQ